MKLNYQTLPAYLAGVIIVVSLVICYGIIKVKEVESMERSIEIGAARGIDPIAVRCAYASSTDAVCVVYAGRTIQK